jgi:PAS domain S-box-containing protein
LVNFINQVLHQFISCLMSNQLYLVVLSQQHGYVLLKTFQVMRKEGKSKLTETEHLSILQGITEALNIPVFSVDTELRYTSFNRQHAEAMKMLYNVDIKLHGFVPDYFQDPLERSRIQQNITKALQGEHPKDMALVTDALENPHYYQVTHDPIYDSNHQIIGAVVAGYDITPQRQTQDKLTKTGMQLKAIMDGMLEGCQIVGFDWKYKYLNDTIIRDSRKHKDQLLNHTMMECYPGIENTETFRILETCMKERTSRRFDNEFIFPDGSKGWFSLSVQPVPEGIFILSLDVTEQKKAGELIKESEERFRHVFESANVGKSITLPTGEIHVNKAFCDMMGYTPEEIKEKRWQDLTPADEIAATEKQIKMLVDKVTDSVRFEKGFIHKSGHKVYCDLSSRAIYDDLGTIKYLITTVIDVTEHKKAKEALQISEQKLKLFVEHAPAAIAMFDNQMRYIAASQRYIRDYGLKEQEIIGRSHYEVFPELTERVKEIHRRCLAGATEKAEEDPFLRADGSLDWVYWEIKPWYESEGKVGGILLFSEVITDKIEAENRILNSEAELNYAQELAQMASWSIDLSTFEIQVSRNYLKIFGIGLENQPVTFDSILSHVHPEDLALMDLSRYHFTEPSEPFEFDFRYLMNDGSVKWFQNNLVPVFKGGKLAALKGTNIDITDKKIREEEIRKINETLEQRIAERTAELSDLYNNSPCGYHSLDPDGVFELVNDTELKWLGYTREELVGKMHFIDLLTESSKETFKNNFPVFKKCGQITDLEFDFIRKDGSILSALLNATAIYDDQGNFIRSRSTIVNHTERKKAEESIKEALINLEAANKELESFSYSISHDLRAPLRAIHGFTRILVSDYHGHLDDEGKRICNIINSNSQKMGKLIDDLLAFSRLGRSEMVLLHINMSDAVKSVIDELSTPENWNQVEIIMQDLPEVNADPALIKQVWINLISNAIKYSSGKEKSRIEIFSVAGDREITFSIKDNGVGFDMQYIDKLFSVFQRLHTDKEFEGTGVGLAIVKRIVTRHGGRVWAESKPNEGAVFSFTIPK